MWRSRTGNLSIKHSDGVIFILVDLARYRLEDQHKVQTAAARLRIPNSQGVLINSGPRLSFHGYFKSDGKFLTKYLVLLVLPLFKSVVGKRLARLQKKIMESASWRYNFRHHYAGRR